MNELPVIALHQAAITNLKDAFCNVRCADDIVAELCASAGSTTP
jgi:hypothetical protein